VVSLPPLEALVFCLGSRRQARFVGREQTSGNSVFRACNASSSSSSSSSSSGGGGGGNRQNLWVDKHLTIFGGSAPVYFCGEIFEGFLNFGVVQPNVGMDAAGVVVFDTGAAGIVEVCANMSS